MLVHNYVVRYKVRKHYPMKTIFLVCHITNNLLREQGNIINVSFFCLMDFIFATFILLISFHLDYGEQPQSICSESNRPYKTMNYSCSNFKDVCVKIGDQECDNFLDVCKQCPLSNYTILMYREMVSIKDKINSMKTFQCPQSNFNILSGILFFLLLIVLVEIRFKIFTKSFQNFKKLDNSQGTFLQSRKRKYQNDKFDETWKLLTNPNKSFDIKFATIEFQFDDIDQEPIELYIHNNHNIVQIKQQICAKLPHAKHDDYKIMKLKYNGIIINDDNQYLLENIDKSNAIVNCFINSSMNASDIVVVKLQGKMRLPDIIQINKNQTIDQLKELIRKMINSKEFSLFKQSNESSKTEELKDNLSNLKDGDWIRIVTKEFGKLIIRSIFDDEDSITIEYANVDLVSSLIKSISDKYNWDLNNFILLYDNKCLDQGKYIYDYQISSESAVKYCCFMKWAGIKMDDDYITKGNFSELRYGTIEKTNRKILIKKYEGKSSKTRKDEESMLKELITFQITKFHRRFIQLLGVYIDDATLYVVMENMDKGTLKLFLQKNYDKLDKNKIYKWSAQILEGLKFLHENKVIHRDLNPSSILVNGNDDLKLSSFNLSKYLDIYKPCSIMTKQDKNNEDLPVRYMAPEILNSDKYGEACDVWSFGAVLIRIITNKKPYSNSNKSEALNQISKEKVIEYKLPDKYSEFKSIIDSCLKYDPSKREKIGNLINNENIGNLIK